MSQKNRTAYGHLFGFGHGVKIKQKPVIGHVGSTGLLRGPHLDYRVAKDGRLWNPPKEVFPVGLPIEKREMEVFHRTRDQMMVRLQGESPFWKKMEKGEIPIARVA